MIVEVGFWDPKVILYSPAMHQGYAGIRCIIQQYTSAVMTSFNNAIAPARGNCFQTNQPDHESDDRALLVCVLPMRKIYHFSSKI